MWGPVTATVSFQIDTRYSDRQGTRTQNYFSLPNVLSHTRYSDRQGTRTQNYFSFPNVLSR